VFVVDTNLLLYAINDEAEQHDASRAWLDDALSGKATIGFAWIALVGFLRISTSRSVFANPLPIDEALLQVEEWLSSPAAVVLHPTERHVRYVADLLRPLGVAGNLVNDAHLAVLAVEHKATVVSFDHDFGRFDGVRWELPRGT
jgi:uncharacterized protein